MAYTDDATLLQDVRNAISAIVANPAAEYTISTRMGSRTYKAHDLAKLRELERDLMERVASATQPRAAVAVMLPTSHSA